MHNLTDEHEDLDLIQAVAKQLHIKTSKELHDLREVLFPSIICAMVHAGAGTQCPRSDLNKRFLPKPKTVTA